MARTVITPQIANTKSGKQVTWVAVDAANGMQVQNSGRSQVVVQAVGTGAVGSITFASKACSHNRTGDVTGALVAGSAALPGAAVFGPFQDPTLWGDGVNQLYVDFTGVVGSVNIAVIEAIPS